MFNPKQALQRIRKQKIEQQQQQQVSDNFTNSLSLKNDQPLFPQTSHQQVDPMSNSNASSNYMFRSKPNNNNFRFHSNESLEDRMAKLQSLVATLNEKLTESNETITMLKQENNTLESQVLKLAHENAQLKTHKNNNDSRTNLANKLSSSMIGVNENNRVIGSLSNDKYQIKKAESKVIEDEVFSPEVDDVMEGIKRQPLQNILKRKEQNFRALKNVSKETLAKGEKALRELANLQKQYGKNYKKPTLILNLQDADFE